MTVRPRPAPGRSGTSRSSNGNGAIWFLNDRLDKARIGSNLQGTGVGSASSILVDVTDREAIETAKAVYSKMGDGSAGLTVRGVAASGGMVGAAGFEPTTP